ncbi:HdeD family acid-resistance protein [Nannocystis bainbridge]|uniref:HdeD family acid-resistance protein n=1 Tax=Nannocystis bainbridge TaxID=2995303 RepID=A0ABT5E6L3_9BACT|nr:HdeD family acid-resistance protein [Nannocystis bainbridge]MDC0721320.1 HdeD family acid-resistance protein [Nannocystis bainbridge]
MLCESLSTAWWSLLLRGLVALLFGALSLVAPGLSLAALTVWFGVFVLVDGVFLIGGSFAGRKENEHWWLMLLEGLCGVAFGLLALRVPGITALVLLMYIAAYAIITGVLRIVMAIRLRKEIEGEWWLALSGLAGVLFGGLMMTMPGAGALALMLYIGVWALLVGFSLIFLAFRVRRIGRAGGVWRGGQTIPAH